MKPQERIIVILLALLNFTHILDFMIMMPLGNLLMPRWGIDSSQFTLVVSCYSFASFISSFCAIFFADNYDRKKLLLVAYAGFLVGTLLCAVADDYGMMVAARLLTGLFGGLISAQVLSIIGDVVPYERRGQAMGLLMGGFGLASVVGVPLGLYLANTLTWYAPFIFVVVVGVVVFSFLMSKIPPITTHLAVPRLNTQEKLHNIKETFINKTQRTALLFSTTLLIGHFIIIPLINPFMVNNAKVPIEHTPLIYLLGGLASLVSAQFIGKLADQYGKYKVFEYSAYFSLPFIVLITQMPVWHTAIILVVFMIWFSAATGRTVPGQAMITEAVPQERRGSFMNLNACMQGLGQAIAMVVSSIITYSDTEHVIHNYAYLGYISVIFIVVSVLLAKKLNKGIG